jgi:hypothetical protein
LCRRAAAKARLGEREAAQRRVVDLHAMSPQQLADLGEPHAMGEVPGDELAVRLADGPTFTARPAGRSFQAKNLNHVG